MGFVLFIYFTIELKGTALPYLSAGHLTA